MKNDVKESLRRIMRASTYWLPDDELEKDYKIIIEEFNLTQKEIF